jgi:RluA family pseudouridine synthase
VNSINKSNQIKIIYQDEDILFVNKPQGMATGKGKRENLCDRLFQQNPLLAKVKGHNDHEGGLLNRLDNETGGLVLFAKSEKGFLYYSQKMKNEKIKKKYLAIVSGCPQNQEGVINLPIAHHYKSKKKMVLVSGEKKYRGKKQKACTAWKLLESINQYTLIEAEITKGRRHQIRLHLASLGCPITGDKLYNTDSKELFPYHLLYAYSVELITLEGKKLIVKTEVPFLKKRKFHLVTKNEFKIL